MKNNQNPNFLFIMCDQLSASALSCYGNPVVKSPNLQRIAEEGVVFENNYCPYPICSPSRASMMSGRLPSKIGNWDNGSEFPSSVPTFAHHLRSNGYYTCLCGKMHFIGPDQLHGFEDRLTSEVYPADFSWTCNWDVGGKLYRYETEKEIGYTDIRNVIDSGVADWCMQMEYDEEVFFEAKRKLYDLARPGHEKPFLLTVSFTQPHDPYIAKQKFWDLYTDDEIDLPKVPMIPYEEQDIRRQMVHKRMRQDIYELTDAQIKRARRAYYAMISDIDDKIGQLRSVLEETGLDENTVIIFTADHGDMMGERGMWYKNCFFENSVHIPLLFHAPGRLAPKRLRENTSLVDLLPTLVSMAHGDTLDEFRDILDGHDLLPLMEGDCTHWDDVVYCEQNENRTLCTRLMVKKGPYKYVWNHFKEYTDALYDLDKDPLELHNVLHDPAYAEIAQELHALAAAKWDLEHIHETCIQAQKSNRLIVDALCRGRWQGWETGKTGVTADKQYVRYGDVFPDIERMNFVNKREE